MGLIAAAATVVERLPLPDAITRAGVGFLVERTRQRLDKAPPDADLAFLEALRNLPIAVHADAANAQHYEVPADFFGLVLGPRRKYSCCLYDAGATTLAQAEERALAETAAHADLADGQRILELGCGWGSLTLYMAERYPNATIVAVSNSASQRTYIEETAMQRQLRNVTIVTADMNMFDAPGRFDRIVSVEMFEHMSNWRALLTKVHDWLEPAGRLFMHIFVHRAASYRFDHADKGDWIAQHFFTGGIMPSRSLIRRFDDLFAVEDEWEWNGTHYARTAQDWLNNFDRNDAAVRAVLARVYGTDAMLWHRRWRIFFLATVGLFGAKGGAEWTIGHYRLQPVR